MGRARACGRVQIDSHSYFRAEWDVLLMDQWKAINNEHGVRAAYPANHHSTQQQCLVLTAAAVLCCAFATVWTCGPLAQHCDSIDESAAQILTVYPMQAGLSGKGPSGSGLSGKGQVGKGQVGRAKRAAPMTVVMNRSRGARARAIWRHGGRRACAEATIGAAFGVRAVVYRVLHVARAGGSCPFVAMPVGAASHLLPT